MINNVVEITHFFAQSTVKQGDIVVDATCGNGYDTLFLSELVGNEGKVYAFDIQQIAIDRTQSLIKNQGSYQNVKLINDTHENMLQYVKGPIMWCMFNLGYLPKGDKGIKTIGKSTVKAISSILSLLAQGGIISICVYLGHLGGFEEYVAVKEYLQKLDTDLFNIIEISHLIRNPDAPKTIIIEKKYGYEKRISIC